MNPTCAHVGNGRDLVGPCLREGVMHLISLVEQTP